MRNNRLRVLVLGLFIVCASGCSRPLQHHGYHFDEESVSKIQPQKTDLIEVINLLGSPTTSAVYGEPKFFYISHNYKSSIFSEPKLVDQKILEVVFNLNGGVKSIARYGMKDHKEIAFASEMTHLPANTVTFMEQFISNIGRFSAAQGARKAGT